MSLSTNITNLATRTGTEFKAIRTLINGNAADLSDLTTTQKANLVAALNWLHAEVQALAGDAAGINDETTSTSSTWSSTKISTEISDAIDALVAGAPDALDTLQELAEALQNNEGEIESILTGLNNRVRFDAAQSLTGPQQAQARSNIGAGTSNLTLGTTSGTAKAGDWVPSSNDITDATATGRAVLTASTAAAARSAIGAGTSSLVIGTTEGTAKEGNWVPSWTDVTGKPSTFTPSTHNHPASQISDSTTVGRAVLTAADEAEARSAIGAGTSDLVLGTTNTTAKAGDWKPTAADITDATTTGRSVLTAASAAAARSAIGAGTSNLALGTTSSTAKAGDWKPASTDITDSTATGRSLLTVASAAAARTVLNVVSADDIGNTEADFVAAFEAALTT